MLNPIGRALVPYCTEVTNKRRENILLGQCYCTPNASAIQSNKSLVSTCGYSEITLRAVLLVVSEPMAVSGKLLVHV